MLGAGIQRYAATGIDVRDDCSCFHRRLMCGVRGVRLLDDPRGVGKRAFDVALHQCGPRTDIPLADQCFGCRVRRPVGMHQGRLSPQCRVWIEHRSEVRIVQSDQLGRGAGYLRALRGDCRDGLADVAHDVGSKGSLVLDHLAEMTRGILTTHDGADARQRLGGREIDGAYPRVRTVATYDVADKHARQHQV